MLRQALLHRLATLGVDIEWQTRLVAIDQDAERARVDLVRRERVEGESPARKPEWLDVATQTAEVDFVIGADGVRSTVRRALRIEMISHGTREIYAFFDAPDQRAGDEAHLVLTQGYGTTVYPLQGNLSRFTFQVGASAPLAPGLAQLRRLLAAALRISQNLEPSAHANLGPGYSEQRCIEWGRLFGIGPSRPDTSKSPDWVRQHIGALLPSLPVAGDDLDDMLEQLQVKTA